MPHRGSCAAPTTQMRTIIAGSRSARASDVLEGIALAIEAGIKPTVIISGAARGADTHEAYAHDHGIKLEKRPADWIKHGRRAGHIRNAEMANCAEALIAIWDGISPGTRGMIALAKRKRLKIYVHEF